MMKIFTFAFLVQFVLLIVPTVGSSSSAELTEHLHSVTVASEDVTSILDVPRVLKKKRKKNPKGGKKSKSAKGSASPSSQPSLQPSLQPTDQCYAAGFSDQKDALLALKDGFTNSDTELSSWDNTTEPCSGDTSNWGDSITCSSGKVTRLEIVDTSLTGTISPSIACLSSLTVLDFNENSQITGSIPSDLIALTSLTSVDFRWTGLTGTIPSEVCQIASLTSLQAEWCPPTPAVTCFCCTNTCDCT